MLLVAAAFFTGTLSYAVTSGVSMQPTYHAGDLVFLVPSERYGAGDVVAYHGGVDGNVQILHRIIAGDASGYDMKGDSNQSIDPTHPRADQLIGRAVLHIPNAGAVVGSPITRVVAVIALLTLLAVLVKKPAPKKGAAHGSRRAGDQSTVLWKTFVAIDIALLAALGATFGLAMSAARSEPAATETTALAYQARTTISDTYPSGTLVTGDAVFTKLVDDVDVAFHYTTTAATSAVHGTARLHAEISTASGWHSSVPLVADTPLVGGRADLTATLDLVSIHALADNVATATGVGTGPINIAITGSTSTRLGTGAAAQGVAVLRLQLTPLELVYAGATPSPSQYGPAVITTSPLGSVTPAHPSDSPVDHLRVPLLVALLLSCGATAVVWPSRGGEVKVSMGIAAAGIQVADRLTRIHLLDRAALAEIASTTGAAIVQGDDGWQGVFTPDVLYWITEPPGGVQPV
ncbi:MAG: S26 family signal peptidase [Ilumatobacteraceae bacterium]